VARWLLPRPTASAAKQERRRPVLAPQALQSAPSRSALLAAVVPTARSAGPATGLLLAPLPTPSVPAPSVHLARLQTMPLAPSPLQHVPKHPSQVYICRQCFIASALKHSWSIAGSFLLNLSLAMCTCSVHGMWPGTCYVLSAGMSAI
jgi:hypothetical protein